MASLKKRPENTKKPWEVRWREGGSGRRRAFRLKTEAKAWHKRALQIEKDEKKARQSEEDEGLGLVRPSMTLLRRTLDKQWADWQAARVHKAPGTIKKDEWVWRRWLKPYLGRRKIGSITHRDLNDVLAKVSASGAGADTRIAVYSRLNMLLDDALGPGNHTCRRSVAGTSTRQRETHPLTIEQLDNLLEAAPEEWRLFIDTLATLGLRPHEGYILRGRDILVGIDGAKIHVRTKKGKKEGARTLPLPSRLAEPLVCRAQEAGPDEPLFPMPDYRNWRKRVWRPLTEAVGMPAVVPYDLRHTAASVLLAKGATPVDVATWLGTSPQMVLSSYAHLLDGRLGELSAILDR